MKRIYQAVHNHIITTPNDDARRLFHGRGHTFPGLETINVDVYPPTLLITLYQKPSDEFPSLIADLKRLLPSQNILVQRRYLPKAPSEVVHGELPKEPIALHNDMKIELNLGNNQNIGYFIDMQSCHDWVRQNAKDKQVLNLFSYTCAFSVAALLGGAKHVVNVDMAGGALSTGRYNHYLNQLDKKDRTFMKLDILKSWSRIKKPGPYDLIIIDPPSNQRGSFVAEKDYRKILRRIPQLATPSGQILACLNTPHLSESYLQDVMSQECPDCRFQRRLLLSNDFPEKDNNCSLKILLFRYL